ncbi:MAG: hypothetical protein DI573_00455 [Microbacterium sp.]|jgi:hypothetical protein|uniref:hypothetical protein n=1 Tax=Microbacterium sp. TaxID=51671 RepID=UPI000DB85416|nr:hypothetical protein [Microbacterium sp.]PZU41555.1 MAG: hypothetical protein DI573_00455 [Microbacterium sp.]
MPTVTQRADAMQIWRVALIASGVVLLAGGALVFVQDVPPERYPAVAAWLIGALVVHDGVAAMAVVVVSVLARRAGHRMPFVPFLIAQGALVVALIMSAVVVPQILKKAAGTANPSVLPLDYALNLGVFVAVLAAVTAAAIAVWAWRVRRPRRTGTSG